MKNVLVFFSALMLAACGSEIEQSAPFMAESAPVTVGKVLETLDVETYTYIRLESDGRELWLATSPVQVEQGDTVRFSGGVMMTDFHGASLDRTFDQILFVGKIELIGSNSMPEAAPPLATTDPHAGLDLGPDPAPGADDAPVIVEIPEDGVSIAQLLADPGKFAGQQVRLRGTVIKVNDNIMGKSWVTLQDGTGVEPENQLTATTGQPVTVGDIVTLTAMVQTNVDLGFGYEYEILLEDAVFE
jgi:starvation-inducible outer membrane lipoprotein